MKHLLLIIAALLFTFCSSKNEDEKPENTIQPDTKQTEDPQSENPKTETNNDKTLIVYYMNRSFIPLYNDSIQGIFRYINVFGGFMTPKANYTQQDYTNTK